MKIGSYKWGIGGIVILAATFTLVAWTGNPRGHNTEYNAQDTVPKRYKESRQPGDRDFDRELRALDKANRELNEKDWDQVQQDFDNAMAKVDFQKIQADIDKALKSVDFDKIQREVRESMAKVDFDKINNDWQDALKNIDFEKIHREIEQSMKNADFDKYSDEWKESMKNVDWEKMEKDIKGSMDKLKEVDMEKMKAEFDKAQKDMDEELKRAKTWNNDEFKEQMEKVKDEMKKMKLDWKDKDFDFKKIMKTATEGIEKAREELKGFQEMVYEMEKDGLLDTHKDYTIEYRDGAITIDGKKQSDAVTNKYKKYFKRDKTSIIKKNGEIDIKHGSSNTHID
jgi:hypothetical protein